MARFLSALSRTGDTLWPSVADADPPLPRVLLRYAGVAAAISLLLVLRRSDGISNPQFWAEDATVFFHENLTQGCWRALQTFFRGFPYVAQTLVACAATPVPIASAPFVYTLSAYAIAAASLATFSLPSFRHVIRNDALRVLFCMAVAALPQARELVGSVTNTSWFLGIWLVLLTIMRLPRSPVGLAILAAGAWLTTFSTPLAILTAPLWLARAIHAGSRKQHADAWFSVAALAGLLVLLLLAGDLGRDPGAPIPPFWPVLNTISLRVLADAALGPLAAARVVDRAGSGVVYSIAASFLIALGVLAWPARGRSLPFLLYCAYGIVASCTLAITGHRLLAALAKSIDVLQGSVLFSGRYQVLAISLVYLALFVVVDRLPRARTRNVAAGVLVAWLVATEAPTFVLPPFFDLQWPALASRLERKLASGSMEPLTIPINPDRVGYRFKLAFDERVIAAEVTVPANTVLGPLLDSTTIEQSFIARCADLSEIDVWLGADGRPVGSVQIELSDATSGAVVATSALDSSAILAGMQATLDQLKAARVAMTPAIMDVLKTLHLRHPFYFAPIRESEGTRYILRLRAAGGAPGNSVTVYGSAADGYRDGDARRDGDPIAGDLAFRYGCTRP